MAVAPFKFRVGRRKLTPKASPAEAAYAKQMQFIMNDIADDLQMWVDHIDGSTPEILLEALKPTFRKSLKWTPELTGKLKRSGFLENKKTARGAQIQMGFGRNGSPPYAIFVHEMVQNRHRAPTRAKWLEQALDEDSLKIPKTILRLTKKAAGV